VSENVERTQRATIRDVAERAGVSISTVSHVFSGGRPISEQTRKRVRQAAEELAYHANPTAQSLRNSTTGIIGLVVRPKDAIRGSLRGTETFSRLMGAIAIEVLERGLALIHVPDLLDPSATQVPMDGCIVAHPYGNDPVLNELVSRGIPVVTVEEDPDHPEFEWSANLSYDDAITQLLSGMKEQGAQRIMLLSGTEDNAWNRRPAELYKLWAAGNQEHVLHANLYEGEGASGAARFVASVLDSSTPPDAFVTGPSTFAAGALEAFTQRGLSTPHNLLLAALSDSEYTRSAEPPITALDLSLEALAANAVDLMIRRIAGDEKPGGPSLVHPELHWRKSTARFS